MRESGQVERDDRSDMAQRVVLLVLMGCVVAVAVTFGLWVLVP